MALFHGLSTFPLTPMDGDGRVYTGLLCIHPPLPILPLPPHARDTVERALDGIRTRL